MKKASTIELQISIYYATQLAPASNVFHFTRRLNQAEMRSLIRIWLTHGKLVLTATTEAEGRYAKFVRDYLFQWASTHPTERKALYAQAHPKTRKARASKKTATLCNASVCSAPASGKEVS